MSFGLQCAVHTKRLLNLLFKRCCCFLQHSYVSRHFQSCWELNQNPAHSSKHLNMIFVVLLLMFHLVSMRLLLKSRLIHHISWDCWPSINCFSFSVMGWRHGTCDHFVALSLHEDAFSFHLQKDHWTN